MWKFFQSIGFIKNFCEIISRILSFLKKDKAKSNNRILRTGKESKNLQAEGDAIDNSSNVKQSTKTFIGLNVGGVHVYNNSVRPENPLSLNTPVKTAEEKEANCGVQNTEYPTVILLPSNGKLELINQGKKEIYLCGSKFSNTQKIIENEPRIIPIEPLCYYFLTDKLEETARQAIGLNGEKLEKFEVYLADLLHNKFVAQFFLNIKVTNGVVAIHTQQLGIKREEF